MTEAVDDRAFADLRPDIAASLAACPDYPATRFGGRGIVICAGGPRYFTCAFVLLHMLRHAMGCTLPVQVWHLGRREMSPAMARLLVGLGAELVDAEPLLERHAARIGSGWALKPYAVLHSRFEEVLSLDADAVPLRDPAEVFGWPAFAVHGALFWPDNVALQASNPVWGCVGLEPRDMVAFETGVFAVDKRRLWRVLNLTVALNSRSGDLYKMIHGEKDSFLLAALLCGQEFGMIAQMPMVFDSDLIQHDEAGVPFVHHRTFSKYDFGGRNREVFGGGLAQAQEQALAALRAGWSGVVFHPPAMSAAALAAVARLVGRGWMYDGGGGWRELVLMPDFQVGVGQAEYERHWAVVERGGGLVLQFYSISRVAVELTAQADGSWAGACVLDAGFAARLVPVEAVATMPWHDAVRVGPGAGPLVAALLAAALAAAPGPGFEPDVWAQLAGALRLLNRTHDDVAACVQGWVQAQAVLNEGRGEALVALAVELALACEARLAAVAPHPPADAVHVPGHYERLN